MQAKQKVADRLAKLRLHEAEYKRLSITEWNNEAAKHSKEGDHITSVALYTLLFEKTERLRLTHPELYVCYSNCAGALLRLKLFDEAVQMAEKCKRVAEASFKRFVPVCSRCLSAEDFRTPHALPTLTLHTPLPPSRSISLPKCLLNASPLNKKGPAPCIHCF